jgi:predicted 2-oxoglutarate/Fe(II)-dependent dioxygenase YbiX
MLMLGGRAPFCCGMLEDRTFYSFEAQAGRPAVLIMVGRQPPAAIDRTIARVAAHTAFFSANEIDLLLIVDGHGPDAQAFSSLRYPWCKPVFCQPEFFSSVSVEGRLPVVIVLDRTQWVLLTTDCEADHDVTEIVGVLAELPTEPSRADLLPAPVLRIPHLLDRTFCRDLIAEFERSHQVAGGVAGRDANGRAVHKIDDSKKKRNDYVLPPDGATAHRVIARLAEICAPEMKKAFQFDAAFTDRLLVARYDDTGGYFRRHRDNTAPEVSFRQFALSVNLNAGYEGGYLTFPEFNPHRYRPEPGAGIIFSASLLHEATPVTSGHRYVLLTFFHSAAMEALRQAA